MLAGIAVFASRCLITESYKRGSHTVWDCKGHLVWVTKYRYEVLGGDVGNRCRELLHETVRVYEMIVHAGSINRDHVHMLLLLLLLLSIPSNLSVSRAVQYLKGRSSHQLLSEFGMLRNRYWGHYLWARGDRVASSGKVTDESWAEYIRELRLRGTALLDLELAFGSGEAGVAYGGDACSS